MSAMKKRLTIDNPGASGEIDERSKLDKILGKHTNSVIVGILFIFTLIAFIIYICVFKDKLSEGITTGLIGLLSGLAGYFAASLKNRTE